MTLKDESLVHLEDGKSIAENAANGSHLLSILNVAVNPSIMLDTAKVATLSHFVMKESFAHTVKTKSDFLESTYMGRW